MIAIRGYGGAGALTCITGPPQHAPGEANITGRFPSVFHACPPSRPKLERQSAMRAGRRKESMSTTLMALAAAGGFSAVVIALMNHGWRGRLQRQHHVGLPPVPPENLGPALNTYEGQYVATTTAGDWLDRITAHRLGIRSTATLHVHSEGTVLRRPGCADLFIPAADLAAVGFTSGMAGKFVERDGLVVLTWHLKDLLVDTGFRTRQAAQKSSLREDLEALRTRGGT